MCLAGVGDGGAWAPEIAVEDEHRRRNWPTEDNLTVATDTFVGEDAVGAFFYPVDHVLTATRPKETHANTEQGLLNAEVTADGAPMKNIKNETA